MIFESFQLSRS